MRLVIDLRWMRPGLAGGIENLSRSFLSELLALDRVNAYRVLVPAEVKFDFDLRHRDNFRFEAFDGPGRVSAGVARALRRLAGRPAPRPVPPDVVLSLSGYIVPDMFPRRNVLVFADLQHEYHPEFFSPDALAERRRVFAASIEKAQRLIAISEFTRRTVIERFGVPEARISAAHLAADARFRPERWRPAELPRVLAKYGLPRGGYLLFPAHTWPHKNHLGALEALARLRDAHGLRPLLALTGERREGHAALVAATERLGLGDQVRLLGYCPLDDMPALYRGAAALFYPSFFEGFGLPLVEAMECECPIVCSHATSLPEIAGDAALLVDPRSPEAMAAALARVLGEPGVAADLMERGRRRVREFSWRGFTLEVLRAVYEVQAAGSSSGGRGAWH
jgi:glycosyltransferase involved in cell wall biosynthesis